ncbi:OmpA family protein [Sphingomonas corticis]|uniref:OmpA family protein n=1 Tax=Sphingomonas corticis TaxID=2722791 RepID=A0ABX1CRY5_9SPHN|nr:OmpA family protein [Sphingomonas corticis]NJR80713.1 OmpA family protein [Sphingomonas corticis]
MADPHDGAPPRHVHVEKKKTNWVAWIALILGVLAALFALSRCNRDADETVVTTTTENTMTAVDDNNGVIAATQNAAVSTLLAGASGLGAYLAGTDALPGRFVFEKVQFDTNKSDIRAQDRAELDDVAKVLKQYPNATVRIAGYADARGPDAVNVPLGKARADAVKAALVARGITASRIETGSGSDRDPVATNATASGQQENRRTEILVTRR